MNNVDALDGLLGFLIPPIIGFMTKGSWPFWVKGAAMLLLSLVIASVKVAVSGSFDVTGSHLATTFFVIAGAAQVTYLALTKEFSNQLQGVGWIKDKPPTTPPATLEEKTNF